MTRVAASFEVDDEWWSQYFGVAISAAPDHIRAMIEHNRRQQNLLGFFRQLLPISRDFALSPGIAVRLPQGGDAVRLAAPMHGWDDVPVGSIGVIQGPLGRTPEDHAAPFCFNHVTFRGRTLEPYDQGDGWVVESAGVSTEWTQFCELAPTPHVVVYDAWRYYDGRTEGSWYQAPALLWDWRPSRPALPFGSR